MTTYAIAGASGQLGRLATHELLRRVDPSSVTLLSRSPAALGADAARGARVYAADLADPASVRGALAGVDRLLLVSMAVVGEPRRVAQRAAIDAARDAGVSFVAYTSAPRPAASNPSVVVQDHFDTEQHLRASGLTWAALRNNIYAELGADTVREAMESGRIVTNQGSGRVAYVTRADCAAAAAAVLAGQDDPTAGGRAYEIAGTTTLDAHDLAELASAKAGRDVEVIDMGDTELRADLLANGLPEDIADVVVTFGTAIRDGLLADASGTVEELTGKVPTRVPDLL